jgi:hypothetical protein
MSLHVGVTAVFKMSAASSNSSATAKHRPNVSRTSFFAAQEDDCCFHTRLNSSEPDHNCRGKLNASSYDFYDVFGFLIKPSHKLNLIRLGPVSLRCSVQRRLFSENQHLWLRTFIEIGELNIERVAVR